MAAYLYRLYFWLGGIGRNVRLGALCMVLSHFPIVADHVRQRHLKIRSMPLQYAMAMMTLARILTDAQDSHHHLNPLKRTNQVVIIVRGMMCYQKDHPQIVVHTFDSLIG